MNPLKNVFIVNEHLKNVFIVNAAFKECIYC